MTTPAENEKTEDNVQGQFIPMREPPGRLGAIVRRLKRMAPSPVAGRPAGAAETQQVE